MYCTDLPGELSEPRPMSPAKMNSPSLTIQQPLSNKGYPTMTPTTTARIPESDHSCTFFPLTVAPRRRTLRLPFLAAAALALAAISGPGCDTMPLDGTAAPSAPGELAAPAAAPLAAPLEGAGADQASEVVRAIEEADIVKVGGDTIYALNRHKGLLIIDVADPDAPKLTGELDLRGRGVEMYVVGSQVYVLLSADFYFPYMMNMDVMDMAGPAILPQGPVPPAPDFEGSRLAIIDASDHRAPVLRGKLNLAGFASESRRVGDVIYVVGSNYTPYHQGLTDAQEAASGFVASVNVADPDNIVAVQREALDGRALVMHVSESAIFAASQEYDSQSAETYTAVQLIDISDPAGAIVVRGSVDVPGHIRNRFFIDDYQGVLRIATESGGFGFRQVRLFTYDLTDLDNITPLGETDIIQDETLEAVRFDGPRGYVVTFLRVDPLFVLDLRDPADPQVAGFLEVPGFSTHLEPRGDRLIAVGIDDTDGRRPAVSYYDVEDPANPAELGRVVLGPPGSFTESEAVYDEKAFKIVDELGLIAIPFKYADYGWGAQTDIALFDEFAEGSSDEIDPEEASRPVCVNAVQLVDFDDQGLAQRGWFAHRGRVQRVGVIKNRVFALSPAALQLVDISDRDAPLRTGQADFFDPDDMPYYADDCAGFFWPIETPFEVTFPQWPILVQIFLDGDTCGMIDVLPALAVPAGLFFIRPRRPSRRRRSVRPRSRR